MWLTTPCEGGTNASRVAIGRRGRVAVLLLCSVRGNPLHRRSDAVRQQQRLPHPEPERSDRHRAAGELSVPRPMRRRSDQCIAPARERALPAPQRPDLPPDRKLRLHAARRGAAVGGRLGRVRQRPRLQARESAPRELGPAGRYGRDPEVRLPGAEPARVLEGHPHVPRRGLLRDRPPRGVGLPGARERRAVPESAELGREPGAERHAVDGARLQRGPERRSPPAAAARPARAPRSRRSTAPAAGSRRARRSSRRSGESARSTRAAAPRRRPCATCSARAPCRGRSAT